jgi:hypothetical protein
VQPSADQFNGGFSWQATRTLAFDIDYVHAIGHDDIHRWRINTAQNLNTRLSPAGVFDPEHGPYIVEGNRGHSKFDGVFVTAKMRTAKTSLIGTYAWSKGENLANDFNTLPADLTNMNWDLDLGPTPNDIRHRFTLGGVFELPADFQVSTSIQANTGKPFNALAGLGGNSASVRAINPATGVMFTRNAFRAGEAVVDAPGGTGGLAFLSIDLRLSKIFKLGGAKSFEILAEVFNLTNHDNFEAGGPNGYFTNFTTANFGHAASVIRNSNRQGEIGVRFRF